MFFRLLLQASLIGASFYAAPAVACIAGVAALVNAVLIAKAIANS